MQRRSRRGSALRWCAIGLVTTRNHAPSYGDQNASPISPRAVQRSGKVSRALMARRQGDMFAEDRGAGVDGCREVWCPSEALARRDSVACRGRGDCPHAG